MKWLLVVISLKDPTLPPLITGNEIFDTQAQCQATLDRARQSPITKGAFDRPGYLDKCVSEDDFRRDVIEADKLKKSKE